MDRRNPFHISRGCYHPQLQNLGYWKSQNFHANSVARGESPGVVWIYRIYHIGIFFWEEVRYSGLKTASMTSERHTDMLRNRIIPSLADKDLLESKTFMKDGVYSILLDKWKNSCAVRLVMIACWTVTFVMLGLPDLQIWIFVNAGHGVTWCSKSTAVTDVIMDARREHLTPIFHSTCRYDVQCCSQYWPSTKAIAEEWRLTCWAFVLKNIIIPFS